MKEKDMKMTKKKIQSLGLGAIEKYFKVSLKKLPPEILRHLHNRAKIAMQFEREINISERAVEMNYLRVFKLYARDQNEIRVLIEKKFAQYLPKQ